MISTKAKDIAIHKKDDKSAATMDEIIGDEEETDEDDGESDRRLGSTIRQLIG